MNARTALEKKILNTNSKLVPSNFLTDNKKESPKSEFYVKEILGRNVYVVKDPTNPALQQNPEYYDLKLTYKRKKWYPDKESYLGWFKLAE